MYVGTNSISANLIASVAGALMYFATLTGILIILCLKRACKRDGSYFLLAGLD